MALVTLKMEELPHYTYDDYVQWEGQWELLKGMPYAMVPAPTLKHQDLSLNIAVQLKHLLAVCEKCHVYEAVDWQIEDDTVPRPDVLVVCGKNPDDKKLLITPVVVFEILSPSTEQKDKVLKYKLYQAVGVKYYCIVDPKTRSAEVFLLKNSRFEKAEDYNNGKIVFDLGPCSMAFDFGEIFKE